MKRKLISACLLLLGIKAFALPQTGEVVSGSASISQLDPNSIQINQFTDKAIIDWESFNLASDEKAFFNQASSSAITLNRINGANGASTILGQLHANGQVWIINSSGVLFGPSALVNVGSLLATTSDVNVQDFMSGHYQFNSFNSLGSVINQGTLKAAEGGTIALIGNGVQNQGFIEANLGKVVLGGAKSFILTFEGDTLLGFELQEGTSNKSMAPDGTNLNDAVSNTGSIISQGGKVLLATSVAQNIVDHAINMSGTIEANHAAINQKGEIVLSANQGKVKVAGQLKASAGKVLVEGEAITTEDAKISTSSNSAKGGTIHLLGKNIKLFDSAVEANGAQGGGEILIGGNYQGAGPELNADYVFANHGIHISADAITQGNGGKVIVWGNEATQFYGSISAQGGIEGGNGGFIETSGHYLDVLGAKINLAAPGSMGTWLLDPADIIISDSATADAGFASNTYSPSSDVSSSTIYSGDLGAALHNANIIVTTNNNGSGFGDIFVNGLSNLQGDSAWRTTDTTTLTLQAARNIQINTPINLSGSGKGLVLSAGNSVQGHIQINNPIDGHFDLTFSSGNLGGSTVNSAIGATTALRSFSITQGTSDIAYNITTTGAQTFNEEARFSGATAPILSGSALNFFGGIDLANSMELNASSSSFIGGTIKGNHGITKSGSGALTLSGDNTYTGGTTIKDGSIIATSQNALGTSGTISLAPTEGSTVDLDLTALSSFGNTSGISFDTSLFGSGASLKTGSITLSNAIELIGSNNTFNTVSGVLNLAGNITGEGGFAKTGVAELQLSGDNNDFAGTATISEGTLSTGAMNVLSSANEVIVNGELDLAGYPQNIQALSGTGTIDNTSDEETLLMLGSTNMDSNFSGIIQNTGGALSLAKLGLGNLTLSGANTFSGSTSINEGTLTASHATALGGTEGETIISSGATLALDNVALSENISLSGTGISGTGALTASGNSSLSGTVTLDSDATIGVPALSSESLSFNGAVNGSNYALSLKGMGLEPSGNITFNNTLSAASFITESQAYKVSLLGTTNVNNAVTFSNTGGGSLGGISLFSGGLTSTASTTTLNGTIKTQGNAINLGSVSLSGTSLIDTTNGGQASGSMVTLGNINGAQDFTINSGTGSINLNSVVGDSVRLKQMTITNANNLTASHTVEVENLTQQAGSGTTNFSGGLNSTESINITTNIIQGALSAPTLNLTGLTGMDVSVSGDNLTVNGASGTINGSIKHFTRGPNALGNFKFNGIVALGIVMPPVISILPQSSPENNTLAQGTLSFTGWLKDNKMQQKPLLITDENIHYKLHNDKQPNGVSITAEKEKKSSEEESSNPLKVSH